MSAKAPRSVPMRGCGPARRSARRRAVGNFVEVKEAVLEDGAKANHLAYIGDGRVGEGANIGAGTIFCNYDGASKQRTDIGKGAFIGSNSALVAPVTIGDGAYIGSGSVITENVPADALALGRVRQVIKEGWASRLRDLKGGGQEKGQSRLNRRTCHLCLSHGDTHFDFRPVPVAALTAIGVCGGG